MKNKIFLSILSLCSLFIVMGCAQPQSYENDADLIKTVLHYLEASPEEIGEYDVKYEYGNTVYKLKDRKHTTTTKNVPAKAFEREYEGYSQYSSQYDDEILKIFYNKKTYTVNFYLDGGKTETDLGTVYDKYYSKSVKYGEKISVKDPVKDGFVFTGWSTSNYGKASYPYLPKTDKNTDFIITDNISFYAKWAPNEITVKVITDGGSKPTVQGGTIGELTYENGISYYPVKVKYGEKLILGETQFTDKRKFNGWSVLNSNGTYSSKDVNLEITEENIIIRALSYTSYY